MASVIITLNSNVTSVAEIQRSALTAGLRYHMVSSNTIDVFSTTETTPLDNWYIQYLNNPNLSVKYRLIKIRPHLFTHDSAFDKATLRTATLGNVTLGNTPSPYFSMNDINTIYKVPATNLTSPDVIGVVSFGGGLYGTVNSTGVLINGVTTNGGILTNSHIQAYWTELGITPSNQPRIIVIPLPGQTNTPDYYDGGSTIENTIDVETIGATCRSSNLTIIIYISKNTGSSDFSTLFSFMYSTNITVNGIRQTPSIISCSWGMPEIYVDSLTITNMNNILNVMTNNGINICTASGDYGSNNGVGGSGAYVDFPSSSPYVTAVGGTSLICPNKVYDNTTVETAWANGGGGISAIYPKPSYQSRITASGRCVPDLASNSDINTAIFYGFIVAPATTLTYIPIGGTSIAAPFIAAYLAIINYKSFINPKIYSASTTNTYFNDIVSGSNGAYSARSGYDNCTGLGTIHGVNLTTFIKSTSGSVVATSISVSPRVATLSVNQNQIITSTILPTTTTNKSVSWSSSNNAIATVTNGLIRGVSGGTAIITVRTTDGSNLSATINITVTVPVTGIVLNKTSIAIRPTITSQIVATVTPSNATNKTVSWISSSPNIATVSSAGLVRGVAIGTAYILAVTNNGKKVAYVIVNVTAANSRMSIHNTEGSQISINPNLKMAKGSSYTLIPTINSDTLLSNDLIWTSSDPSIVVVDSNGCVNAINSGTTTVYVSSLKRGVNAQCNVTVV